jgi:hypothetical protein
MQWTMRAKGYQFYLEPKARSCHLNYELVGASLALRFHGGRLFAANRSRGWSVPRRVLYTLASPLIPLVRLARTLRFARRIAPNQPFGRLLPLLVLLLVVDGLGELIGYGFGGGSAERFLRRPPAQPPAVPATGQGTPSWRTRSIRFARVSASEQGKDNS